MKTKHTYLTILLLMALICTTCIDDRDSIVCPEEREATITFTVQLPIGTLAAPLDDAGENAINDFTIILFRTNSQGKQEYVDNVTASTLTPVPNTPNQYTLQAKVKKGAYYFMFLANTDQLQPFTFTGKEREEIEEELQLTLTGRWDIDNHPGFPMWSMIESEINLEAYPSGYTHPTTIGMIRMLARINLTLSDAVQQNFTITRIRLHNPSGKGRVIPHKDNLITTTGGTYEASDPTLPRNAQNQPDPGMLTTPWEYTGTDIDNGVSCTGRIYAMENFSHTGRDPDEYTWLELGCSYQGDPEELFRVDFEILRNHSYNINVLSITNKFEVEVHKLEDSGMSTITPDGQYQLKVNQATFLFNREERDKDSFNNTLEIYTNHEDGWTIESVTDPDNNGAPIDLDTGWLQIIQEHRKGNQGTTPIKLLVQKNETAERKAEIRLKVGRLLDFVVKVIQGTHTELELFVEDMEGNPVNELFFYEYYGWDETHTPQDIHVRWSPKGGNYHCKVEIGPYGDIPFEFDDQSSRITTGNMSDPEGFRKLSIHPKPFTGEEVSEDANPFLHRGMQVLFTVTDEQDPTKSISKTLYLRHQHFAIITKQLDKDARLGSNYTFDILSNTSWEFESMDDEGILSTTTPLHTTGGNNIVNGDPFDFDLVPLTTSGEMPAMGVAGRKATFYLKDLQGYIPEPVPVTVTATYNDPNSYILNPAGSEAERTVEIPIRKLFWVWDLYALQPLQGITSGGLEAGVVWEEVYQNTSLNSNPVTYNIQTSIQHKSTHILEDVLRVTLPDNPNVSGNAVVGVKHNNEWLYSWHIWITGYNPESTADGDQFLIANDGIIMGRNLGALEYNPNQVGQSVNGVFYQWGRKDPMHPSFANASSPAVSATNNLGNVLNNPDKFYRATSGLRDWFTNHPDKSYQNDYLWNTMYNQKGIFDPCPEGWKLTGADWDVVPHEWSNIGSYYRNRIEDPGTGRVISIELMDGDRPGTPYHYSLFHYSGRIAPSGNWERHTADLSTDEYVYVGLRTPTTDNPTYGGAFYRTRTSTNSNGTHARAYATPTRCIKEK